MPGNVGFSSSNSKDSKVRVRSGGVWALEDSAPVTMTSVIIFALRGILFSPSKNFLNTQNDINTFD